MKKIFRLLISLVCAVALLTMSMMNTLALADHNSSNAKEAISSNALRSKGFPSNAEIGDTYTETYNLTFNSANMEAKGIVISVEYTYGPDNHCSISWTPGYQAWELCY